MTRTALHALLGTRWALPVLGALERAPYGLGLRFNQLLEALSSPDAEVKCGRSGVSHKVLSGTLRQLCDAKLVEKTLGGYVLTDRGAAVLRWSTFPSFDWLEAG